MKKTRCFLFILCFIFLAGCTRRDVTAQSARAEHAVTANQNVESVQTLNDFTYTPMMEETESFALSGRIDSTLPLASITLTVMRDQDEANEIDVVRTLDPDTASFDLAQIKEAFHTLTPGEKFMTLSCSDGTNTRTLVSRRFTVLGKAEEARHMTLQCRMSGSGDLAALTDDKSKTAWGTSGGKVTIDLPAEPAPGALYIRWNAVPVDYTVSCLNDEGAVIDWYRADADFEPLNRYIPLDIQTKRIVLETDGNGAGVSELRVYPAGRKSVGIQDWNKVPEKVDIMVVSTHQDDELLFFGGAIPYYAAHGKQVEVIYMADCGFRRLNEAMDGLWSAGLTNYPLFLGLKDKRPETLAEAKKLWNEDQVLNSLVSEIRRRRPEVLVTHDINGETGHMQHVYTSELVRRAVELANDPSYETNSAKRYGIWNVPKEYIHLYDQNEIEMDWWTRDDAMDGRNAFELASIGYDKHRSQHKYYTMREHGKHDNAKFGLYRTTVGPDIAGGDFFENLPSA